MKDVVQPLGSIAVLTDFLNWQASRPWSNFTVNAHATIQYQGLKKYTLVPYELERGNCNYCHPNIGVGKLNCRDTDLLENINMMVQ